MGKDNGIYHQDEKLLLRDDYPRFYYSLLDHLSSLPGTWFFVSCFDANYDGSRFVIDLHDGHCRSSVIIADHVNGLYEFSDLRII